MNLYYFSIFALIILCFVIINSLIPRLNLMIFEKKELKKLQYGITSRQDLFYLDKNIRNNLFENLLSYLGYDSIVLGSTKDLNDINYIGKLGSETLYVLINIVDLSENINEEEKLPKLGRPEVQKFLGTMVHGEIKKGVIITNGAFTSEALIFVSNLPDTYEIKLIDGINLTKYVAGLKYYYNLKGELIYA